MEQANPPSPLVDASSFKYVVGVDLGSQTGSLCALKPNKSQGIKPPDFANAPAGFGVLQEKLERLGVPPEQVLIGVQFTSQTGNGWDNTVSYIVSNASNWVYANTGFSNGSSVPLKTMNVSSLDLW